MNLTGPKTKESYQRSFRFNREAVDTEKRTVELAFSSEEPYERGGFSGSWMEILGHDKGEIDLSRFESGGHPLLLQHDSNQQIGVIEKAWLDEKDRRGRAVVRFAKEHNQLADTVWKDVLDGIRSQVSVGYIVNEWKRCSEDEDDKKSKDAKEKPATWRAIRWQPLECSIVATAADPTVGIGREAEPAIADSKPQAEPQPSVVPIAEKQVTILTKGKYMPETEISAAEKERLALAEKQAREKASKDAEQKAERELFIRKQEEARVNEIYALTEKFKPSLREKAMAEGWTVDQVRAAILDEMNPGMIATRQETETRSEGRSIGEIFVNSPQYRELGVKMGNHERGRFHLEIPNYGIPMARTSLIASSQLSSYLTSSQALPGVPGILDQQQIRVAQLFPTGTTTSRRISYVKEDAFTNAATGVAENAAKPESSLNISETYSDVMKVAVWTKVTEEMLADQDAIRSYIDNRLAYMVMAHEDDDLLNGTSAANEVTGILQTSGIQTQAVAGNVIDAIGQAIGKVRNTGFVEPTGIVMNSQDWVDLSLTKDANNQYLAGGPFWQQYGNGQFSNLYRLWGIPVVITSFIAEGTALVGAFNPGAQIFRRTGLKIESTNTDSTDFEYNLICIRAEARMALCVYKPLAFCSVTGIA